MAHVKHFGAMPDGAAVMQYTLQKGALSCDILTYGGTLRALRVPDRAGRAVDVLLGYDTLADYRAHDGYLGALVGRCANRIGGAAFTLNGVRYPLAANDGANHLHGGRVGFDKRLWTVEAAGADYLLLSLESADGEEGYPGCLRVRVLYRLEADGLVIDYRAVSDRDTLCNLTNHAYFNLSGHSSGDVLGQTVEIAAHRYTPTDATSIPTGEVAAVTGTPMDLRTAVAIGRHIDDAFPQLKLAGGYDHNYVLEKAGPAAAARSEKTGITMTMETDQPGVQFYAGNYLDERPGKGGAVYGKRHGFCLEAQCWPDSPHHPHFPSAVLRAGAVYRQTTAYRFSAER